jgi:CheY-like chemotaxis protein
LGSDWPQRLLARPAGRLANYSSCPFGPDVSRTGRRPWPKPGVAGRPIRRQRTASAWCINAQDGSLEKGDVAGGKRILIVDDEAKVLFVMSTALRMLDRGLEITAVRSGQEALQEIEDHRFDLVITDLKMPDVSGVKLTEVIRAQGRATAVVWITAYGCYRVHEDSGRLGVYRCLDKPVKIDQMREVALEALQAGGG